MQCRLVEDDPESPRSLLGEQILGGASGSSSRCSNSSAGASGRIDRRTSLAYSLVWKRPGKTIAAYCRMDAASNSYPTTEALGTSRYSYHQGCWRLVRASSSNSARRTSATS